MIQRNILILTQTPLQRPCSNCCMQQMSLRVVFSDIACNILNQLIVACNISDQCTRSSNQCKSRLNLLSNSHSGSSGRASHVPVFPCPDSRYVIRRLFLHTVSLSQWSQYRFMFLHGSTSMSYQSLTTQHVA
jgi:hypothetical protein